MLEHFKRNLLALFYADPITNCFQFQCHAMVKMNNAEIDFTEDKPWQQVKPKLMERSVEANTKLFAPLMVKFDYMTKSEYKTHLEMAALLANLRTPEFQGSLKDPLVSKKFIKTIPSGVVLYQQSPEKCLEQIQKRGRKGEHMITLEYLQEMESIQHEWLVTKRTK